MNFRAPPWRHQHLLDVAGLAADELARVLELADDMAASLRTRTRRDELAGQRLVTLFSEPSTRTRLSFEVAARALGAEVSHLEPPTSSMVKGESLVDTVRTLAALGADVLVIRHRRGGAPALAARHFPGHVINAGDGTHAHPTQALSDLYTLRRRLARGLSGARVTILGDILHSRVARSNAWSLTTAGAQVTLCGPAEWLPDIATWLPNLAERVAGGASPPAVRVTTDIDTALSEADAVMTLRIQNERLSRTGGSRARASRLGPSPAEYVRRYRLTSQRLALARPDAIVLHPGPVNEGVEITREVSSGPRSVILDQVANGVPVRMAMLALLSAAGAATGSGARD
ncbi:MAG: aspartate carbamoyltransferase catalytic subunit [Chloroflexota bacterium]|nr:aspartate carbamoyltransferase catalytic subunit [Chloroflexota bacterium]